MSVCTCARLDAYLRASPPRITRRLLALLEPVARAAARLRRTAVAAALAVEGDGTLAGQGDRMAGGGDGEEDNGEEDEEEEDEKDEHEAWEGEGGGGGAAHGAARALMQVLAAAADSRPGLRVLAGTEIAVK